ncbi:MAG: hypothetical protein KDB87_10985, partial [Flavobacteriales bacterium]|nr:hypothetical protein [Flavobacteriales bacterium]
NGSVVLTLTSTNTGTCPPVQDQLVLTFGNSSFADAGDDLTTCANSPVVQLNGNVSGGAQGGVWSTSGTGSFNNTSFLDPTYTLSASDLANGSVTLTLTTITGGACLPVSDQVTVTVNGLPA